jgi:hypothetical protein
MTFWCGSESFIFVIDLQEANKNNLKKSIFAYYFLKDICIIFKDKKSKRSHKTVGIKVFPTIFAR